MKNIVVVGPGRMGTALALALQKAGCRILAAYGRDKTGTSADRFTRLTASPVYNLTDSLQPLRDADIVLVTVPDKAVTDTAQTLVDTGALQSRTVIAHTAGALPSEVLHPVVSAGCKRLSLHPLQTIADPSTGAQILNGAYCTLEGDAGAVQTGAQLVAAWGGIPVVIQPEQRPQYHAAAVLASNAVVALTAVAANLLAIPEGLQVLLPLLRGAVSNLEQNGLPQALTGPVERGDVSTIFAHLHALQSNPTALHVYSVLGQVTADLARQKGSLSMEQWQQFQRMFRDDAQL